MAHRLNLLIVDDEPLFLELLERALSSHLIVASVVSCTSSQAALESLNVHAFDVAILDIQLGPQLAGYPQNGLELGRVLREKQSALGIVMLSHHRDFEFVRSLSQRVAGGWSYLLKSSVRDLEGLVRAVQGVSEGLVILDPSLTANSLLERLNLGERQLELLSLIAQGYSNAGIASQLALSTRSVDNQMGQLYTDLGLDTHDPLVQPRVGAVLRYLEAVGP
jgi:DNA-binding NarL/FixJ family response regulator